MNEHRIEFSPLTNLGQQSSIKNPHSKISALTTAPICLFELPAVHGEYLLAFQETPDARMAPIVVLGEPGAGNSYMGPTGHWSATYIPAHVRNYPFWAEKDSAGKVHFYADGLTAEFPAISAQIHSQSIHQNALKDQTVTFDLSFFTALEDYLAQVEQTKNFMDEIQELGLFTHAQVFRVNQSTESINGLFTLDEAKTKSVIQSFKQTDAQGLAKAEFLELFLSANAAFQAQQGKLA